MPQTYASEPWFPSSSESFTAFAAITHSCNQKCLHCFADNRKVHLDMIEDKYWFGLFDQLSILESPRLFLTGGEPLLHPLIYNFIFYASKKNIPIILGTNATLIDEKVINKLIASGLAEARVSLDGATSKAHDAMRGTGTFMKAINGIKLMINSGIKVTVRTTVNQYNYREMQEIRILLDKIGVMNWEIKHIIPKGRAIEHPELLTTALQRKLAVDAIIQDKKSSFSTIEIRLMEGCLSKEIVIPNGIKVANCPAGDKMVLIQPDGSVHPCGYLTNVCLGNVVTDSLESIRKNWLNENKAKISNYIPTHCNNCKNKELCNGGCPAYNFCE